MRLKLKKMKLIKKTLEIRKELSFDLPDQYKEFFISSPSFMLSNLPIHHIRKKDIPVYKEMIFKNDGFVLVGPTNNEKIYIKTLREYEEYSNKGYYGQTSCAIGMETLCYACLQFFYMLEKATPLINKIEFRDYVRGLPIEILSGTFFEDQFEALEKYDNIGNFIDLHIFEGSNKTIA
ncbi:MAG: hypothetical protein ACOH2E_05180 [Candidatus Paracaedibacter sp.]